MSLSYINARILTQLKSITGYKKLKITSNKKAKLDGGPRGGSSSAARPTGETVYGQATYAVKGAFWYFIGFDGYTKWNDELARPVQLDHRDVRLQVGVGAARRTPCRRPSRLASLGPDDRHVRPDPARPTPATPVPPRRAWPRRRSPARRSCWRCSSSRSPSGRS